MTQPNRPRQQFQIRQRVATPNDWSGVITRVEWADGEWAYDVVRWNESEWHRYAEHELTEAGR
jgi:hypothetical protein